MLKYLLILVAVIAISCSNTSDKDEQNQSQIPGSPYEVNTIKNGEEFPSLSLKSADGSMIDLDSLIAQKPTIFIYFRGGWCYYCNLHFDQIHAIEDTLLNLGYQMVTVSSDLPEKMTPGMKRYAEKLLLLSDADSKLAKKLGIAYALDESAYQEFLDLGIELEKTQGNEEHLLPVPGVFIVDKSGVINFNYINPDHKIRLHPNVMVCAAKEYLDYSIE